MYLCYFSQGIVLDIFLEALRLIVINIGELLTDKERGHKLSKGLTLKVCKEILHEDDSLELEDFLQKLQILVRRIGINFTVWLLIQSLKEGSFSCKALKQVA